MSHSALFVDRPSLLLIDSNDRGQGNIQINLPALRGLLQLKPGSFRLIFIGNEDSLAFDRVPEKKHQKVCGDIQTALNSAGIPIIADYTCPFSMTGSMERRRDSVFRLPNVGAMKAARLEFDVHLESSWVISDRAEAMLAGSRSGARTALIRSERNERRFDVTPDLVADDLGTAVRFLLKLQVAMSR